MNILFIIGNGFDLNLGMKTKYSDFYEYYHLIHSHSTSINKLKDAVSNDFKNWSDLELALGKYTEKIESVKEFDEIFDDLGDNLADFLQKQEYNFDFSKIESKKLFNYLAFPENSLLQADKDKLNLYKRKWTNTHWSVNITTFNYTHSLEKLIGDNQKDLLIGTHNGFNIMLQGVEHIHGYINDRMILGVNDVSQISNTSFHENPDILEALVKSNCNQAHKHTIDDLCKQQISNMHIRFINWRYR